MEPIQELYFADIFFNIPNRVEPEKIFLYV